MWLLWAQLEGVERERQHRIGASVVSRVALTRVMRVACGEGTGGSTYYVCACERDNLFHGISLCFVLGRFPFSTRQRGLWCAIGAIKLHDYYELVLKRIAICGITHD